MLKSGRSELFPLFMKMMAKMQSRSPAICMICGISSKRKIDRIVGIRMPSLLNVVVNGAPFLRILIWSSTSAARKPIPFTIPAPQVTALPLQIRDLSCNSKRAYQASSQIISRCSVHNSCRYGAPNSASGMSCTDLHKWQQSDKSYIQSPRIKAFLHA